MSEIRRDGFKFSKWDTADELLVVEPATMRQLAGYVQKHPEIGLAVSRFDGYREGHLDFLQQKEFASINRILIQDVILDISSLYSLKNLQKLWIVTPPGGIDLRGFPLLMELDVDWNKNVIGFESLSHLAKLTLRKCAPASHDLTTLKLPGKLKDLSIIQGTLTSLTGIERLPIQHLMLAYLPKLQDVSAMLALRRQLIELRFDHCKNAEDLHSLLPQLAALQKLMLTAVAPLPDVAFVSKLKALKFLSFVHTMVDDGDMTPLLRHTALEYVGYLKKKNFSHSSEQVCAALQKR